MTIREWILANYSNYPTRKELCKQGAIELNAKYDSVVRMFSKIYGNIVDLNEEGDDVGMDIMANTISEHDIRKMYDNHYIISQAVEKLKPGFFVEEAELLRKSGVKMTSGYRNAVDHPDFAKYKGKAGGKVYWGHPDNVKKLKSEGILL